MQFFVQFSKKMKNYVFFIKIFFFFVPFFKNLNYDFFTNEYTMQLWKKKNLTAEGNIQIFPWREGNISNISLSQKLTDFCKILNCFRPYWRMQNTKIREGNMVKIRAKIWTLCPGFLTSQKIIKPILLYVPNGE